MSPRVAWCGGCGALQQVDQHWLAFFVDSDGRLIQSVPEKGCDLDYERPGTVFACGQGSALIIFERFLHNHTLEDMAYNVANLNPSEIRA